LSLAALAIRTCALLALRGNTAAGLRVYDSSLSPIDELRRDEPQPFLTIAVDEAFGEPEGHDLLSSVDRLALLIEIGMGQQVEVPGQDGSTVSVIRFPLTDGFLETSLDLISHQVVVALAHSEPWGDLFRRFVMSISEVRRIRAGMTEAGDRFAARQIMIDLVPIGDPDVSTAADPDAPWGALLAALRAIDVGADPELEAFRSLADAMEATMRAPAGLASWQITKARLGVAQETADALGFTPAILPLTEIDTITLLDDGPERPIDADAADASDGGEGEF
jgi:hypothetical protein